MTRLRRQVVTLRTTPSLCANSKPFVISKHPYLSVRVLDKTTRGHGVGAHTNNTVDERDVSGNYEDSTLKVGGMEGTVK